MVKRALFIDGLAQDMQAIKLTNIRKTSMLWLVVSFTFTVSLAYITGSYRSGIGNELLSSLQFLVESVVGIITIALLIYTAFDFSIPSAKPLFQRLLWPLTALATWVGFYMVGLVQPALEPLMSDKRGHCSFEVFIYAMPILLASFYWIKKQWPLDPKTTGLLAGLSAGAVPALIMQFACMYEPQHILLHHILPGLSVGLLGGLMGMVILRSQ